MSKATLPLPSPLPSPLSPASSLSSACAPSLDQVRQAFSDWRAAGATHRTPVELQRQAASLLDRHTAGRICKALSLDHRRLKRWRAELMNAGESSAQRSAAFVEVPATSSTAMAAPAPVLSPSAMSLTLTHRSADGSALSISGHLEAPGWRWALGLLREPGR